jgi:hypothetical protein
MGVARGGTIMFQLPQFPCTGLLVHDVVPAYHDARPIVLEVYFKLCSSLHWRFVDTSVVGGAMVVFPDFQVFGIGFLVHDTFTVLSQDTIAVLVV